MLKTNQCFKRQGRIQKTKQQLSSKRFIDALIEEFHLRRGTGLMNFRCLTGEFEMVEDFLDDLGIFYDGDDAHAATTRTGKDIDAVNAFEPIGSWCFT